MALPEQIERKPDIRGRRRRTDTDQERLAWTVDSFQGNEADVVIVSLVRNNALVDPQRALGFLDDPGRLNVLLSRAERLLVLIGSWDFFQHQLRFVNIDDQHEPFWHWKKVVTELERSVASGSALMIDAMTLEAGL